MTYLSIYGVGCVAAHAMCASGAGVFVRQLIHSFSRARWVMVEAEKGECWTRCVCIVLSEFFLVGIAASPL